MGWASNYISALRRGETVSFRPRGHSMSPRIMDGQLVDVAPLGTDTPEVGEVVLCRVRGNDYLHLVKAKRAGQFQIGNNKGRINGWVRRDSIFGRVISIQD